MKAKSLLSIGNLRLMVYAVMTLTTQVLMNEKMFNKIKELEKVEGEILALENERRKIREEIGNLILEHGRRVYLLKTDKILYVLKYKKLEKINYHENLLKDRLQDRFKTILVPDPNKLRKNMDKAIKLLDPILEEIGKVSKERVKEQVKLGHIQLDEFKGAFTKEVKNVLYVSQGKKELASRP